MSYELNTVSMSGLVSAIEDSIALGVPLMILGSFGLGKTWVARQVAQRHGYTPLDWWRAASATPDMVAGMPYMADPDPETGVRRLQRATPELVAAVNRTIAAGERPFVFMDELNLGTPFIVSAMLQFLQDRRLGEHTIPEDVPIIAAGNLDTDGSVVMPLPLPAANRMRVVRFRGPTFDEWAPWAHQNGIHPAILGFLKDQPAWLALKESIAAGEVPEEVAPAEDTLCWPTPRSWHNASRHLTLLEEQGRADERLTVLAGYVGDAAASRLEAYLAVADTLTPVSAIMEDPEGAPIPTSEELAPAYMTMAALAQYTHKNPKPEVADAALVYLARMDEAILSLYLAELRTPVDGKTPAFDAAIAAIADPSRKCGRAISDEVIETFVAFDG